MFIDLLFIAAGIFILFIGGEAMLRGSLYLAKYFSISRLLVSSVIIGYGTSLPEFSVTVEAAYLGSSGIAIGNIVGSNISNMLLVMGIACLIHPVVYISSELRREIYIMLSAMVIFIFLASFNLFNFLSGLILIGLLVAFIAYNYHQDRKENKSTPKDVGDFILFKNHQKNILKPLTYCALGLAGLFSGSWLLVDGAISLARIFQVPESIIGLSLVAVGTSLPELATIVSASIRKQTAMVLGNVIGSNIFNSLGIIGFACMFQNLKAPEHILQFDQWIMLLIALIFSILLLLGKKLNRIIGLIAILGQASYIFWLYYI